MPILSGLVVSVDAFFIGLSLGMQKQCKFIYLVVINIFLFGLCALGFILAGRVYELIPFDPDLVVGFAFISLGIWTILQFFITRCLKRRRGAADDVNVSIKAFAIAGLVMSGEAMLITMGITIIFLPDSNFVIPLTVALAHFGYSALSFRLARSKYKTSPALSNIISGLSFIAYGMMALFVEIRI